MEIVAGKWISELEMEDPSFFPHYQMLNPMDYAFDDFNFQSFSSESHSPYPNIEHKSSHNMNNVSYIQESHIQAMADEGFKRPTKQVKTNSWNSCITNNINNITPPNASSSSSSHIISFDNNSNSSATPISQQYYGPDCDFKPNTEVSKKVASLSRTPLHAQDHVIAERKRREKLSQRFISLTALIPGLKKTDKASVLGDAIKYLKQLQERVSKLEEQVARETVESAIYVKKTQIYAAAADDDDDEKFNDNSNKPLPEIEARVADKDVLIRIHCKKNKGCISNIINEVEKLHLSVLNTNALPFGKSTQHITIVAQMEAEFSMTVKDLVKSLRVALLKFM